MRVLVVGGGVMGLSAAWALVRDGHDVTVLEQGPIPNPKGSSVDAHRLIRYAYGGKLGYTRMVAEAYADWDRLWQALGERLYQQTGTLLSRTGGAVPVVETAASFDHFGIPYEMLDGAAVAARFPVFTAAGIGEVLYSPTGGVLLADRIVDGLCRLVRAHGASVRADTRVRSIDPARAHAVLEDGTTIEADCAIVAAGPWVARLLPAYAGRVKPSRQIVAYLAPPPHLAAAWSASPMLLHSSGGIGFYIVPPVASTPLKTGDHGFTLTGDPDEDRAVADAAARRVADSARVWLGGFDGYRLLRGHACFYTVEPDEQFLVEPVGGRCWVMTGFSGHGFKFGPTMGRAVAEAVTGRRDPAEVTRWAAGLAPTPPAAS